MTEEPDPGSERASLDGPASRIGGFALLLLVAFVAFSLLAGETANETLAATKGFVLAAFDRLFIGIASATLLFVLVLALHPRTRKLRLGAEDATPEFSRFSWFSMLFSAGLASGLLYWAAAEPILHFQANPLASVATHDVATARATALRITIFHWGLHGWGLYVLGGLAIGLYSQRSGRAIAIRSTLIPLVGVDRVDRWPGRVVDFFALLGTVFGVATSMGLAAAALNATLHSLLGLPMAMSSQIGIVLGVCACGIASALSGLHRGVRRLSEMNVVLSAIFLGAFFVLGSSSALLLGIFDAGSDYFRTLVPLGFWRGGDEAARAWQGDWTVFYWGWWLAWMPFVSLFIARISNGRSVFEFVSAVLGVPTIVIVVWMTVLGGTALDQEIALAGSVSEAVARDYSHGIVAVLRNLAPPGVATAWIGLAAFLLFTWLITSLDSATIVITHLVGRPEETGHKALWGLVLAGVTAALIWTGGIGALQAASIVMGLPIAIITLLILLGLARDLFRTGGRLR